MEKLASTGRVLFAVALACLALQQIAVGDFVPGPFSPPVRLPARGLLARGSGLVLFAAAAGTLLPAQRRRAGVALAVLLALILAVFHLTAPLAVLRDGVARSRALEALVFAALGLMLAGLSDVARWLFALSLVVFGVQHFLYAR